MMVSFSATALSRTTAGMCGTGPGWRPTGCLNLFGNSSTGSASLSTAFHHCGAECHLGGAFLWLHLPLVVADRVLLLGPTRFTSVLESSRMSQILLVSPIPPNMTKSGALELERPRWTPRPTPTVSVLLGKVLSLTGPQFLHLINGNKIVPLSCGC